MSEPSDEPGQVPLDHLLEVGAQMAQRFPSFESAGLATAWTRVYDVPTAWNPVLGRVGDLPGLIVACGFSGHGFKLSPAVGRVLAQQTLGLPTNLPLAPQSLARNSTPHARSRPSDLAL